MLNTMDHKTSGSELSISETVDFFQDFTGFTGLWSEWT